MAEQSHRSFWRYPATRRAWWAFAFAAAFMVMSIFNAGVMMQLPEAAGWRQALRIAFGLFILFCGLAGGLLSLISLIKDRERSWIAWVALLPAAFVLFLLFGEFLFPH